MLSGFQLLDSVDDRLRRAEQEAQSAEAEAASLQQRREAVRAAQAERDRRAAALREAEAAQHQALDAARQRAVADPEWQRLRASAEEAARIAQHAEEKAAFARGDLATKGKPYLDDPLFAYLWRRGWGTAAYRAGPLTRLLDGWVARIARYEPAR